MTHGPRMRHDGISISGLSPNFSDRNGAQQRSQSAERFADRLRSGAGVKGAESSESGSFPGGSLRGLGWRHSPARARSRSHKPRCLPPSLARGLPRRKRNGAVVPDAREGGRGAAQEGTGSEVQRWRRQFTRERHPPAQVLAVSRRRLSRGIEAAKSCASAQGQRDSPRIS